MDKPTDTLSSQQVDFLYERFLNRIPESDEVRSVWMQQNWQSAINQFFGCEEFRAKQAFQHVRFDMDIMIKTRFDFLLPVSFLEPLTITGYGTGDYEREESDYVWNSLIKGDYAVDLGARHGWFTGIMAKAVGAEGRVYSFDPVPPKTGVRMLAAVNGFDQITAIDAAASDQEGESGLENFRISKTGSLKIMLTTLDRKLSDREKPISLIKLDIEGSEPLALRGAEGILRSDKPKLVMEISQPDLQNVAGTTGKELLIWLREIGYTKVVDLVAGKDVKPSDMTPQSPIINVIAESA